MFLEARKRYFAAIGNSKNQSIQERLGRPWAVYEDQKYPWRIMWTAALDTGGMAAILSFFFRLIYEEVTRSEANDSFLHSLLTGLSFLAMIVIVFLLGIIGGLVAAFIVFFNEDLKERKRLREAEAILDVARSNQPTT